jgi:integrase
MSLYKRGATWWLYIVHKGQRVRRSCETSDRDDAQEIHDKVRAELWDLKPTGGPTFHEALDQWQAAGARDRADQYRLAKFKKLCPDRSLYGLTADDLTQHVPDRSPATFNRYVNLITAALNLAKDRGHVDAIPKIPHKKTPAGRLRVITPKEWRRLQKQLPDHLRDMAEFALLTGLRQRNVTHLEWSQVDLRRKTAWIHADQAKARQPIGVPLSDPACAILRGRKGQSKQWVFPYKGKPLGKIKTAWRKALKRAKIAGVTWHTLRHTWASWHAMSGTPIPALKELGGWRTLSMVNRYSHFAPDHLRQYAGAPAEFQATKPRHSAKKK